jgi:membrane protein
VVVLLGAVLVASWPSFMQDLPDDEDALAGQGFAMALGCLRLLQQARLQSTGGWDAQQLAWQLRADVTLVQDALAVLVQLDWAGYLNEDGSPRYVLLIDTATTRAAPLMNQLLLNDNVQTQAVWARWKDWRLAELLSSGSDPNSF